MLEQTDNCNTYPALFLNYKKTRLSRKANGKARKAEAAPRLPLRGLYVLEPFGILWRRKGRNEGGLPLKEADLSSLLAPTQETRMLRVRTTHVSLQFIISWGRYQLPRRQLSIARDPDIKPHCDCSLNKDYHLTLNLIMLREMESTSKKR